MFPVISILGHLNDNDSKAKLLIKTYSVKPSNIAVFDAKEVLDTLKKNDELQKDLMGNK